MIIKWQFLGWSNFSLGSEMRSWTIIICRFKSTWIFTFSHYFHIFIFLCHRKKDMTIKCEKEGPATFLIPFGISRPASMGASYSSSSTSSSSSSTSNALSCSHATDRIYNTSSNQMQRKYWCIQKVENLANIKISASILQSETLKVNSSSIEVN